MDRLIPCDDNYKEPNGAIGKQKCGIVFWQKTGFLRHCNQLGLQSIMTLVKCKMQKIVKETFPKEFGDDIEYVLKSLSLNDYRKFAISEDTSVFILFTGEEIHLPYRIYFSDELKPNAVLTLKQQLIYHCLFSRSSDGFVREKHIMSLLKTDIQDWYMPFVFKVCSEYVVEILNDVFQGLSTKDNTKMKEFCRLNIRQFLYGHARMISYWNEFYRDKWYRYDDYIGKQLFSECFGYSRCLEKLR